MSVMMGGGVMKGEDGMMPGRHLLMASSNFSPHDLYGDGHHYAAAAAASAINSSTTDSLFSITF